MNSKRILAIVMVLVMVVSMFAACGGSEDPATTTTAATTTAATTTAATTTEAATTTAATTTEAATTEATTTPEPALDLTGYEFVVVNFSDAFPAQVEGGVYASQIEEQLADELFELEERLGITIVNVAFNGDHLEQLTTSMLSGDKIGDVFKTNVKNIFPIAKQGGLVAMNSEEMIALGMDWQDETRWFQPTIGWTEMYDQIWGVDVASEYVACRTGYFVQTNKEICAAAGYPDLYQLVRDYEWTWDVFRDIAKKSTYDNNGDGQNDIWGLAATAWGNEVLSNNVQFVDEIDGVWSFAIDNPQGITALQFLYDINMGDDILKLDASNGDRRQLFCDGYVAFNMSDMGRINGPSQQCFNTNHPYGIVPIPLGPDATEYVAGHNDLDALSVQSCNKDLEKTVAIMNEWALIVNDTEAYLDVLDDGRCHTEEDKEMMIEYIIPNFAHNRGSSTPDLWSVVDDDDNGRGMINDVSYNGYTPQQAIEANKARIQGVLDAFFNN
ncbi:MAG: extracellular solute-binding protein [Clostridia bacterium]|nr:extracellular solute-binding protein [Clostridia bacterium]